MWFTTKGLCIRWLRYSSIHMHSLLKTVKWLLKLLNGLRPTSHLKILSFFEHPRGSKKRSLECSKRVTSSFLGSWWVKGWKLYPSFSYLYKFIRILKKVLFRNVKSSFLKRSRNRVDPLSVRRVKWQEVGRTEWISPFYSCPQLTSFFNKSWWHGLLTNPPSLLFFDMGTSF